MTSPGWTIFGWRNISWTPRRADLPKAAVAIANYVERWGQSPTSRSPPPSSSPTTNGSPSHPTSRSPSESPPPTPATADSARANPTPANTRDTLHRSLHHLDDPTPAEDPDPQEPEPAGLSSRMATSRGGTLGFPADPVVTSKCRLRDASRGFSGSSVAWEASGIIRPCCSTCASRATRMSSSCRIAPAVLGPTAKSFVNAQFTLWGGWGSNPRPRDCEGPRCASDKAILHGYCTKRATRTRSVQDSGHFCPYPRTYPARIGHWPQATSGR